MGQVGDAISFPYIRLCKTCYRISSVTRYQRYPLMVLYSSPHSQVMHVPDWSSQDALGLTRVIIRNPSPLLHFGYSLLSFISTKGLFSTNRLHWSDMKGCMKKLCCFRCHFEENNNFDAFWHFCWLK